MEGVTAHGSIQVVTQEEMSEGGQTLRRQVPEQRMAGLRLKRTPIRDTTQSSQREKVLLKSLSPTGQTLGMWDNFKHKFVDWF